MTVVPHGCERLHGDVGAAVNESPESREALVLAARLAASGAMALRVLTAVHVASPASPMFAATGTSYQEWREARRRYAERVAHEAIAAAAPDSGAKTVIMEGDPLGRLGEASRDLGLLVVGSRRYGPLRSALLGGVSGGLIDRAGCLLIVVPRGVHRGERLGRRTRSAQAP